MLLHFEPKVREAEIPRPKSAGRNLELKSAWPNSSLKPQAGIPPGRNCQAGINSGLGLRQAETCASNSGLGLRLKLDQAGMLLRRMPGLHPPPSPLTVDASWNHVSITAPQPCAQFPNCTADPRAVKR